ncbi:MAG: hypothetical protein J1F02_01400 [Lachnospiraceae bacterium]|nr:hypothetical protein [Lachnospiraceae bacterium]
MKKRIAGILSVSIIICLCAGCSGQNTAGDTAAQKTAASGSAVSGSAVKLAEQVECPYPYVNSTNFYVLKGEGSGIYQYTLTGEKRETDVPEGVEELIWVDDTGIGYQDEDGFVWCIPVHKGQDGTDEELSMANRKKLFRGGEEFLKTPKYIFYLKETEEEVGEDLYRYNCQTGKQDKMPMKNHGYPALMASIGNDIYIDSYAEDRIIRIDMDTGKEVELEDSEDYHFDNLVVENRYLIYRKQVRGKDDSYLGEEFKLYDSAENESSTLISKEELEAVLLENEGVKLNLWDYDETLDETLCGFSNFFYDNGRLYLEFELGWPEEGTLVKKGAILSKSITGEGELVYEKEMTEALRTCADKMTGTWKNSPKWKGKNYRANSWESICYDLTDGKMVLTYMEKKKTKGRFEYYYRIGTWNMQTKELTRLTSSELEYYYPCKEFSTEWPVGEEDGKADIDYDSNYHQEFRYWPNKAWIEWDRK